jgi:hypothetical protein
MNLRSIILKKPSGKIGITQTASPMGRLALKIHLQAPALSSVEMKHDHVMVGCWLGY